jgi:hypothetical protein
MFEGWEAVVFFPGKKKPDRSCLLAWECISADPSQRRDQGILKRWSGLRATQDCGGYERQTVRAERVSMESIVGLAVLCACCAP